MLTKNTPQKNTSGFTLIELLIVIAIIGVLSGIVLAVLNPSAQRRKARESVLRSNVNKICLAYMACLNSSQIDNDNNSCDTIGEIGVNNPNGNPPTATYGWNTRYRRWEGTLGSCTFYCYSDGKVSKTGSCLIN